MTPMLIYISVTYTHLNVHSHVVNVFYARKSVKYNVISRFKLNMERNDDNFEKSLALASATADLMQYRYIP